MVTPDNRNRFAPVELVHLSNIFRSKQLGQSFRNHECRIFPSRQPVQGRQIQMVVMIVADQDHVDGRKIFESYARVSLPARTCPGNRAGAFRPDRIGQDVATGMLEQNGGMVHKRDARIAGFHSRGRRSWLDVRNEARRRLRTAGPLPSKHVQKPQGLGSAWIVEVLSVEVLGESRGSLIDHHLY